MGATASISREEARSFPQFELLGGDAKFDEFQDPEGKIAMDALADPFILYGGAYEDDSKNTPNFKYVTYTEFPRLTDAHQSQLKNVLTPHLFEKLKDKKTHKKYSFSNAIMTGVILPQQEYGVAVGDEESVSLFKELYYPLIKNAQGYDPFYSQHPKQLDSSLLNFPDKVCAEFEKYLLSCRVRFVRNLSQYSFPPGSSNNDRVEVEDVFIRAFSTFSDKIQGQYYKLADLTTEQIERFRGKGLLLEPPPPFHPMTIAGVARSWPYNRGMFITQDDSLALWVNETDHLRLMAFQQGGNIKAAFDKAVLALQQLESGLAPLCAKFAFQENLGYISSSLDGFGTGMRPSVIAHLASLSSVSSVDVVKQIAGVYGLQAINIDASTFELSRRSHLGQSEIELLQLFVDGLKRVLHWEIEAENGASWDSLRASIVSEFTFDKHPGIPLTGFSRVTRPIYNKGPSFSHEERNLLHLRGFFPGGKPPSLELKMKVALAELGAGPKTAPITPYDTLARNWTDLDKYLYLQSIQDRDETLFYSLLINHLPQVMPYVYTPAVGVACQQWHRIAITGRQSPRGVYLTLADRGSITTILREFQSHNHPPVFGEADIKVIVVTDGERILGLGDLGVNGMGISVGKLALYTAAAGIAPWQCLPVHLDVGTNNKQLREDPAYMGLRHPRVRGDVYHTFVDEFINSAKECFGSSVLIQFEDFGNENAFTVLYRHIKTSCCFNDDIQGTASVVLGGVLSSLGLCGKNLLMEHTFLFLGAGEAGVGIANQLAYAISVETSLALPAARSRIWMVDSKGLITSLRPDYRSEEMAEHKRLFAHALPKHMECLAASYESQGLNVPVTCKKSEIEILGHMDDTEIKLLKAIEAVRPTALIGVSAQGGAFSPLVVKTMSEISEHPLIFALSNPTSKAECTAETAYTHSNGRAVFASGSPFDPVTMNVVREESKSETVSRTFYPGQGNNAYIFPGVGLAAVIAQPTHIAPEDFYVAAKCLASLVSREQLSMGCIYPPLEQLRVVSTLQAACFLFSSII